MAVTLTTPYSQVVNALTPKAWYVARADHATTGPLANITTMTDYSGEGNHVSRSSGTLPLVAVGSAGKPVWDFGGDVATFGGTYGGTTLNLSLAGGNYILAAFESAGSSFFASGAAPGDSVIGTVDLGGGSTGLWWRDSGGNTTQSGAVGNFASTVQKISIVEYIVDASGNVTLAVDGISVATGSATLDLAYDRFGLYYGGGYCLNGQATEFIFCDTPPTDSQRVALRTGVARGAGLLPDDGDSVRYVGYRGRSRGRERR